MEFLVRQNNRMPADPRAQRLREELRLVERKRARESRDTGILVRLWRVPGTRDAIGRYQAREATEPHYALASLPLFPWLEIDVRPLATHPQEQPNGHMGGA